MRGRKRRRPSRLQPPAPPPLTAEQANVDRTLRLYEAAHAARDLNALRRIQTLSSAEASEIKGLFARADHIRVTIDKADIRIADGGRRATVNAQVARRVTEESRVVTTSGLKVFTLEKRRDGSWTITSIR